MSFRNCDSSPYYRAARNPINQTWSENRSDFCLMQNMREKLKEAVTDGLHP